MIRPMGTAPANPTPLVGIIMGSKSDFETMRHAADKLDELKVAYEKRVVSAHRTPDLLFEYCSTAESRGLKVIIAGAGGAAHLPGMAASKTMLPVLDATPLPAKGEIELDRSTVPVIRLMYDPFETGEAQRFARPG